MMGSRGRIRVLPCNRCSRDTNCFGRIKLSCPKNLTTTNTVLGSFLSAVVREQGYRCAKKTMGTKREISDHT